MLAIYQKFSSSHRSHCVRSFILPFHSSNLGRASFQFLFPFRCLNMSSKMQVPRVCVVYTTWQYVFFKPAANEEFIDFIINIWKVVWLLLFLWVPHTPQYTHSYLITYYIFNAVLIQLVFNSKLFIFSLVRLEAECYYYYILSCEPKCVWRAFKFIEETFPSQRNRGAWTSEATLAKRFAVSNKIKRF